MLDLPRHVKHGRGELARGADDAAPGLDALEAFEKVDVKVRPPKLAVGDAANAALLLQPDDGANRVVFDEAERFSRERARLVPLPGLEQRPRPEKAAHVIGAERGRLFFDHGEYLGERRRARARGGERAGAIRSSHQGSSNGRPT